ncbi:transcription/translation regulatory transformer protein RfaH [Thioalkalivibrio sp. HL-Eb18]|uniref:transcription/translation regulatory transformer protein RfaH n=1 Tax=Thioalkalivibrio sp. HL-Eb18 TaxID=1266913 RepID=UPI00036C50E7|nr:transcription/translation regulatory transformer protein RfaH [Thioalkalivibrio sp. HL-Eb18]
MKHWYIVHCKPREESRAEEHLLRQGYATFRPLLKRPVRRGGRPATITESLFPRYLFVELCDAREDWAPIRSTRGVIGLVRFGMHAVPVPGVVIDGLRARVDETTGCLDLVRNPGLRPHQRVTIAEGPFAGHDGLFLARSGEERVIVLMEIMRQQQHLELPAKAVVLAG